MIWKTVHLNPKALKSPFEIQALIQQEKPSRQERPCDFSVGIVGGGPKGLYALEELFRRVKNENLQGNLNVYWWNESTNFGSGPNYQPYQPDYLLINYCIGHIDAWDRAHPEKQEQLNLMQWIEKYHMLEHKVQPTDYASRALVGYYLQHTLLQIIQSKPQNLTLFLVDKRVNNIKLTPYKKLKVLTLEHAVEVDQVLLATGHCYQNKPMFKLNNNNNLPNTYFNSAYPIDKLQVIKPQQKVGIIGWGLTFIDVALALTEGRGGTFDEDGKYTKSGNEPVLLPFSRNQLPIMPRGPIAGKNVYTLKYIDDLWLNSLKDQAKHRKVDFHREILPQLKKECRFAYYSTLLQTRETLTIEDHINSIPEAQQWTLDKLLFPKIPQLGTIQESYIHYIDYLISEAEKGELKSPLMAAAAVWREAYPWIAAIYAYGGLTGDSQSDLDQKLLGACARTSYGPPIENMKKIRALLQAEVIKILGIEPIEIELLTEKEDFRLKAAHHQEVVDFLVDARIARPQLLDQNAPLYEMLYEQQLVKPFENQGYLPGGVWINHTGRIKHPENIPIYLYGSNTEGTLFDNDSLSRKKNNLAPHWVTDVIHHYKAMQP